MNNKRAPLGLAIRRLLLISPILGANTCTNGKGDTHHETSPVRGCTTCEPYQRAFTECLHGPEDLNGTPCESDYCIENIIKTATCGLNRTDAVVSDPCIIASTGRCAVVQTIVHVGANGCSSEPTLHWQEFAVLSTLEDDGSCVLMPLREACVVEAQESCNGVVTSVQERYLEFECN